MQLYLFYILYNDNESYQTDKQKTIKALSKNDAKHVFNSKFNSNNQFTIKKILQA